MQPEDELQYEKDDSNRLRVVGMHTWHYEYSS